MGPFSVQLKTTLTPATVMIPQYILEIEALAAVNMSKKVFVYRKTSAGNDVFEGVASMSQLLQIPEDTTDPEGIYPEKFRTALLQLADQQPDALVTAEAEIKRAVLKLTNGMQAAYDLSTVTVVYIGVWGTSHSTDAILGVE
jgi:hypothetical protein